MKITIIGGGNLGGSIALGLLKSKFTIPENITITKKTLNNIEQFTDAGVRITTNNQEGIDGADIVIIAVKPFQIERIITSLHFTEEQLIISTVTGIWLKDIKKWLSEKHKVFRAMPNTAIAIQKSITCISYEDSDTASIKLVTDLFNHLGSSIVIEEKLMDAATVIGACGIAFAMRYIRASIQGGVQIGFSAEQASFIVSQTVNGAAELLLHNHSHPEAEIDKVTTPRGCTIAGLNELEHKGFSSAVIKGVTTSFEEIQ